MSDIVILKQGFIPEEVPFELECDTCGCNFRLSLKNMHLAIMPDENYYWVDCPCCKRTLSVSVDTMYTILKIKRTQWENSKKEKEEAIKKTIDTARLAREISYGAGEDNGKVSNMVK